jgi:Protein of unknown function (DUF2911)
VGRRGAQICCISKCLCPQAVSALHSWAMGGLMFRARIVVGVCFCIALVGIGVAQDSDQPVASCNLDDGKQVSIRYNNVSAKNEKLSNGKPWTPGGSPMTLFTEAQLTFGGATIAPGAYTVYPIPGKQWTLAVNKNVAAHSSYDEKDDVARSTIETDQVGETADSLEVAFAHMGEKCTLRIYFAKTAVFATFTAK